MSDDFVLKLDPPLRQLAENARRALGSGQLEYVIDATAEILRDNPRCVEMRRLGRSARLRQAGRRGRTAGKLKARLALVPLLLDGRNARRRLAAAEKALAADPASVMSLRILAGAARELGWPETEVFARDALRELRPADHANAIKLGQAWLSAGEPARALELAHGVLRAHPADAPATELMRHASIERTMNDRRWDAAEASRKKPER